MSGSRARVSDLAIATLSAAGFRLVKNQDGVLEFIGPSLNSTRQNPILGASHVVLSCADRELTLDADLGGAMRMQRFVRWFPILLPLSLGMVLAVVFAITFGAFLHQWSVVLLPLGLGAVLALFMGLVFKLALPDLRVRTEAALREFLQTLAVAASDQASRVQP